MIIMMMIVTKIGLGITIIPREMLKINAACMAIVVSLIVLVDQEKIEQK